MKKEQNLADIEAFNWEESKRLLGEISEYFKAKIFNEDSVPQDKQKTVFSENKIDLFIIHPSNPPFFDGVKDKREIEERLSLLEDEIYQLCDSIADIIDQISEAGAHEDDQLYDTLEMILSLIQRFQKSFKARSKKLRLNLLDIGVEPEELYDFLQKILDDKLIKRVMPVIYDGMKDEHEAIYESFLVRINEFLSVLGVHTLQIQAGQEMNYEFCTPIDSNNNITNDKKLKEIIKDVRQLPYIFDEEHIVSEGEVVVWRYIGES